MPRVQAAHQQRKTRSLKHPDSPTAGWLIHASQIQIKSLSPTYQRSTRKHPSEPGSSHIWTGPSHTHPTQPHSSVLVSDLRPQRPTYSDVLIGYNSHTHLSQHPQMQPLMEADSDTPHRNAQTCSDTSRHTHRHTITRAHRPTHRHLPYPDTHPHTHTQRRADTCSGPAQIVAYRVPAGFESLKHKL